MKIPSIRNTTEDRTKILHIIFLIKHYHKTNHSNKAYGDHDGKWNNQIGIYIEWEIGIIIDNDVNPVT